VLGGAVLGGACILAVDGAVAIHVDDEHAGARTGDHADVRRPPLEPLGDLRVAAGEWAVPKPATD
jgi:hypothetical protein